MATFVYFYGVGQRNAGNFVMGALVFADLTDI